MDGVRASLSYPQSPAHPYNSPMDKAFWHQRWRNGEIAFHGSRPHWALEAHWHALRLPPDTPVLVPLCGKSLDLHWLRQRGHPVDGIELDSGAVEAFFNEWRAADSAAPQPERMGCSLAINGLRLWNQDFFQHVPTVPARAFYDRAALVALPEAMRTGYLAHLRRCLATAALGLLVTFEYQQDQRVGPPFSVLFEEVIAAPGFSAELLERRDVLAEHRGFRERGMTALHEAVYRLTAV